MQFTQSKDTATPGDHVILELVKQAEVILTAAQEEQWDQVNEQMADWQALLYSSFESNKIAMISENDQTALQRLFDINNRLIVLVEKARDSIAVQLKEFKLGRKAVHTYGEYHEGIAE